MADYATCRLIFPPGTAETVVGEVLSKYTKDFSVANYYPEREIGCLRIAFAVVDIPHQIIPQLHRDEAIQGVETMMTFNGAPKSKCAPADC